jgi:hypothetical protein
MRTLESIWRQFQRDRPADATAEQIETFKTLFNATAMTIVNELHKLAPAEQRRQIDQWYRGEVLPMAMDVLGKAKEGN